MEREQFTFFSSFAKAGKKIKSKAARCDYYDAIINYALFEIEPDSDNLPDAAALGFELVKPVLDKCRKRAESGKRGGETEANGKREEKPSKPEAIGKQTATEGEEEREGEGEREHQGDPPTPLGEVMSYFLDRINATPPTTVIAELAAYTEALSAQVVLHALEIAVGEKIYSWSYIKAILQRYQREGLTSLEEVQFSEQRRAAAKSGKSGGKADELQASYGMMAGWAHE